MQFWGIQALNKVEIVLVETIYYAALSLISVYVDVCDVVTVGF